MGRPTKIRCTKCEEVKLISEFHKHIRSKTGVRTQCKICTNKANSVYQKSERGRETAKRHRETETCRSTQRRLKQKYYKDPELRRRMRVRQATNNAIRGGTLKRLPCERCGDEKSEAHHDDYDKPLKVRFLCGKHHKEHHTKMKANDQIADPLKKEGDLVG